MATTHHHNNNNQQLYQQYAFTWSPEQIDAWLQHCGCGEAVSAFRARGVDGPALSGLMRVVMDAGAARLDDRLKSDFGVEGVGLRLRLVDRLMAELSGGGGGGGSSSGHRSY